LEKALKDDIYKYVCIWIKKVFLAWISSLLAWISSFFAWISKVFLDILLLDPLWIPYWGPNDSLENSFFLKTKELVFCCQSSTKIQKSSLDFNCLLCMDFKSFFAWILASLFGFKKSS
jgi:hypothetical protein